MYRILIQPPAADDLDAAYRWIARDSPRRAEAWLDGVVDAIQTLSSFPRRCPLAPEDDAFDVEIRQLLYGDFRILHVRHGARRSIGPEELLD